MYTAEELRQDILANLKGNADFPAQIPLILESAVFQFNDTNYFTRVIWNTYERNLIIFCATEDRSELEKYKEELFSLCTKVHGTQDCYLLMTLEIIAKSTISPATKNSSLTDETISISNTITINRSTDYVGHGGFASVYKYYDEEKEKLIAIKIYDPSAFQDSSPEIMKKRFLREGKKLLGYSHPNVVKVFDYGFLRDDSAYIKMEYISGTRLYDYVITNGPLNSTLVNSLCYQYIDAMAYVHSQTDIHRDISYSNVMINTSNEIKVLDFGFARNSDDTNYDTEYKDIQRKFVLPNETYTFRTEIYCIGAILYTLITGNIFTDYDSTLLNNATCDTKLIEATKICLQNNPQNRFEDAIALKKYVENDVTSFNVHNFSLDSFKKLLKDNIELHFAIQQLPTKEDTKYWLENKFREHVQSCAFLSTLNLISLMNLYNGVTKISYFKNVNYDLDKTLFLELIDFYDTMSKVMQDLFNRGLHIIILQISKDDDYDLPFI